MRLRAILLALCRLLAIVLLPVAGKAQQCDCGWTYRYLDIEGPRDKEDGNCWYEYEEVIAYYCGYYQWSDYYGLGYYCGEDASREETYG